MNHSTHLVLGDVENFLEIHTIMHVEVISIEFEIGWSNRYFLVVCWGLLVMYSK